MEGNPYIMSILTQIGVIFTALCSVVIVIIQAHNSNKGKKTEDLMKTIDSKIDKMKEDSEKSDREIRSSMEEHHLRYYKDQLVSMLSRIENGYIPTVEEKHILHEQKAAYNDLGGDSYVDEFWDRLIKKNLI